jgi:hypothetical protein
MMTAQNESTPLPKVVHTTRRARLLLSASLLLVLVFFLLCQFVAIPFLKTALNRVPPSNLATIKSMLIGFALICTVAGIGTILYGRKILRNGQYPPDNAWVWRDTLIQHDQPAVRFAWFHIVIGVLICIIGIGSAIYLWRVIDQAMSHANQKPFVILEQKILTKP